MRPRTPLARSLIEARARTDTLFGLVKPDAFYERPVPERHRIIFYLGHLDAFDWNQIGQWALGLKPFHASFDQLFAFGIDPPVGRQPDDKPSDWPALDEVRGYTQQVRQTLDDVLDRAPEQSLHVAVEHRLATANVLRYSTRAGVPAWVWTVDEEDQVRRFLADRRVAVLITNRPGLARAVQAEGPG